jgi:hypothetical protein
MVRFGVAVLIGVVVAVVGGGASAEADPEPSQIGGLTQQAYLYGFPLMEFLRVERTATSVRCPDSRGNAPVNVMGTARRFARPQDRTVVAPNVDTLYSTAHLDLGRGPVVLSHPAMGRRYFVFQLLDPYTNTMGYIGSRTTGSGAGRFAVVWTGGPRVAVPRGVRVIRSAYRRVWVIGRTLASGVADQRKALRLMDRYRLTPPGGARRFSAGCRPGAVRKAVEPSGLAFLNGLNRALADNPPAAADANVLSQIKALGVGPGLRVEDTIGGAGTRESIDSAVRTMTHVLPRLVQQSLMTNAAAHGGWSEPADDIGNYGTDYTYRAGVALAGLGANTRDEATYPTAYLDARGARLNGADNKFYKITFTASKLPPARAFWSLTAYDADGYLVANTEHRYAIGSSHPPLVRGSGGTVNIILSHTKPSASRLHGANWLPIPSGPFRLNLRLYEPRTPALNGTWSPPPVTPLA